MMGIRLDARGAVDRPTLRCMTGMPREHLPKYSRERQFRAENYKLDLALRLR